MTSRTERRAMNYPQQDDTRMEAMVLEAAALNETDAAALSGLRDEVRSLSARGLGENPSDIAPGLEADLARGLGNARASAEERLVERLGDRFHDDGKYPTFLEQLREDPDWEETRRDLHYHVERNAAEALYGNGARGDELHSLTDHPEARGLTYIDSHPEADKSAQKFMAEFRERWPDGMSIDDLMDIRREDSVHIAESFRDATRNISGDSRAVSAVADLAATEVTDAAHSAGGEHADELRRAVSHALRTAGGTDMEWPDYPGSSLPNTSSVADEFGGEMLLTHAMWNYAENTGGRNPDEQIENENRYYRSDPDYDEEMSIIYGRIDTLMVNYEERLNIQAGEHGALTYATSGEEHRASRLNVIEQEQRDLELVTAHGY